MGDHHGGDRCPRDRVPPRGDQPRGELRSRRQARGSPATSICTSVPRWVGDTNFMTAVAGVRVLPESLPATWERLHAAWPS